jgi:hypothetical protein
MVRSNTLPFNSFGDATPGQLTWVYVNQLIDYEEEEAKVHAHCKEDYHQERCPVCNKPVIKRTEIDIDELPDDVREQIYRPGEDVETPEEISARRLELEEYLKNREN